MARDLERDLKTRKALSETGRHNEIIEPQPIRARGRVKELQGILRSASAPVRGMDGDLTGMMGLLETPAEGGQFGSLGKNADIADLEAGGESFNHHYLRCWLWLIRVANIPQALSMLQARLRALETEASLSRRRVRELEDELEKAHDEVNAARRHQDGRLREVIREKSGRYPKCSTRLGDLADNGSPGGSDKILTIPPGPSDSRARAEQDLDRRASSNVPTPATWFPS